MKYNNNRYYPAARRAKINKKAISPSDIEKNVQAVKVVIDFGRHKQMYDALPCGRNYLTPNEILAIQELNLDDKSALGIIRDSFTLACVYGGSIAKTDNPKDMEAYCHCVGVLLILAGIVAPMHTECSMDMNQTNSFYHTFYADPELASRTYTVNRRAFAHVYAKMQNV